MSGTDTTRDDVEHFDVLIVGAGLSGIGAAWRLQAECPWVDYAIFEARDSMGGTWDLFRYPGIRSDSDMFTLGYSFRPWDGSKAIADGASILAYIKETALEAGIDQRIRYHHRIVSADWSSEEARWTVVAERSDTGETVTVTCDFYYSCSGYYRYDHGYLPDFAGMDTYEGTLIHPQHWPEDLDYTGKKVVVIGSGATAVTLVPAMTDKAAKVTMLQRSPSYVASVPATNPLANAVRRYVPQRWSAPLVRWIHALGTQGLYQLSKRRPALVRKILLRGVTRQLPPGYDVATHFTPHYDPWDQRLCAVTDGDLFKAIKAGKADVVTDHVDTFTKTGIRLRSGRELEADIIVTATGLELLFLGGVDVVVDGEKVDVSERLAYKGMMLEGVPNMAMAVGYTNASWTLKADLTSEYVARLLNHMRAVGVRQCTPVNQDPNVEHKPLLGLNSGYITRSADDFPKQGTKFPWQVHQSYLKDYKAMHGAAVDQDAMLFTNPVPRDRKTVAAAAGRA
ncbi:MAG: NAD(P)/FAD-dependent oxidoreductase [Acidimicrobiales bacterium]|nr:NAD(P)/FAD-dependent oxidoreductase [Acidimicrobiales bacterium]